MASGYPTQGKQPSPPINAARILPHDEDTNDRVMMLPSLSHQENITLPSIHSLLSNQQDDHVETHRETCDTFSSNSSRSACNMTLYSDPLLNPLPLSSMKPSQMLLETSPSISSSPFISMSPSSGSTALPYRLSEKPHVHANEPQNMSLASTCSNPSSPYTVSFSLPTLTAPSLQRRTPSPPMSRNSPSMVIKHSNHNDLSWQQQQVLTTTPGYYNFSKYCQNLTLDNPSSSSNNISRDILQHQSQSTPQPYENTSSEEIGKIERGIKSIPKRKTKPEQRAKLENQEKTPTPSSTTLNFVNNFVSITPSDNNMILTLSDLQEAPSHQSVQFSMHSPRSSKSKRQGKKTKLQSDSTSNQTASSSDEATQKASPNEAASSKPAAVDGLFMEFVGVQNPKKRKEYRDIISYKDEFFTDSYNNNTTQKRLRESSSKYRSKQPLNTDQSKKHSNKEKE